MRYFLSFLAGSFLLFSCNPLETVETQYDDGSIKEKYTLSKETGLRQGAYISYYPGGSVFEESRFENDTLQGERKLYYKNGQIQSIETLENGRFSGPYKKYYENGQIANEGQYTDDEMSGVWKRWNDAGNLMEEVTFAHNEENGPFKEYHENGQLKTEGEYAGGENEDGELREYDEMGELVKKMYCEFGICATAWTKENGAVPVDTLKLRNLAWMKYDSDQ